MLSQELVQELGRESVLDELTGQPEKFQEREAQAAQGPRSTGRGRAAAADHEHPGRRSNP